MGPNDDRRSARLHALLAERAAASHDGPVDNLELLGSRTRLRSLTDSDQSTMRAILGEPDVARWWVHESLDLAVDDLFDSASAVHLAIEFEGEVVGLIQFSEELTFDYRHAGIDLFVATRWQGMGIGPEAIRLVARHLFEVRGHHRLTIDPSASNERAIRAYEKVGFRPVGIMREYERDIDGVWHDGLLMDMLASELR